MGSAESKPAEALNPDHIKSALDAGHFSGENLTIMRAMYFWLKFGGYPYSIAKRNWTDKVEWRDFCNDLCMEDALFNHLDVSPFDMRAVDAPAAADRALSRFFEAPGKARDRKSDRSGAKLVASFVFVYGLGNREQRIAALTPAGHQYASHFGICLEDDHGNKWAVEKGRDGVVMRRFIKRRMHLFSKAYDWIIPECRDIRMEDIREWAVLQHDVSYEEFGMNCKRLCHDFFVDFNVRVEPYKPFRFTVEQKVSAMAARGEECYGYTDDPLPTFTINDDISARKADVPKWIALMEACLGGDGVVTCKKAMREPFVVNSTGGAEVVKRLVALCRSLGARGTPMFARRNAEHSIVILVMHVATDIVRMVKRYDNLRDMRASVVRMFFAIHHSKPSNGEMVRRGLCDAKTVDLGTFLENNARNRFDR